MPTLTPEQSYLRKLVGLPPRPTPVTLDPDDPAARHLTIAEAARAAHVTVELAQKWADRKLIEPVDPTARPLRYRELDVLRAEAATRRAARTRRLLDEAGQTDQLLD